MLHRFRPFGLLAKPTHPVSRLRQVWRVVPPSCRTLAVSGTPLPLDKIRRTSGPVSHTPRALPVAALVAVAAVVFAPSIRAAEPDFNRDVRPLLAKHCFACHGPDESTREAGLRLDAFDAATEDRGGFRVIEPSDAAASELIARVAHPEDAERMPPAEAGRRLTETEIEMLAAWIDAGAQYEPHWAFVPPQRPELEPVATDLPQHGPIDALVQRQLMGSELAASESADRYTLVRRLYLDLTGLPPSPEAAERFVHDDRPDAVVRLVDSLLASPDYAPRWARRWLDLARYADTNGYEKDRERSIWPYRDWVLRAINSDMPYDVFSIQQLAGDMLPDADQSMRVATGFHRNTMLNEEGGIDPLEYRFYAMVDRVATTGTVWMGLTLGCAQCHTHKFDPITHHDYYATMGLLDNADEPTLTLSDRQIEIRRKAIEQVIQRRESRLAERFPPADGDGPLDQRRSHNLHQHLDRWIAEEQKLARDWTLLPVTSAASEIPRLRLQDDGSILSTGDITKRDEYHLTLRTDSLGAPLTALRLEVLPDPSLPAGGPGRAYYEGREGDFFLSEIDVWADGERVELRDASHDYGKISIGSGTADAANVIDGDGSTGWSTSGGEGEPHRLVVNLQKPVAPGATLKIRMLHERHFAASLGRFRWSATSAADASTARPYDAAIERILASKRESWAPAAADQIQRVFLRSTPLLAEERKDIEQLRNSMPSLPTTLVMSERPADNPRTTRVHHRGEYLQPQDAVDPGVPGVFLKESQSGPTNRLEFARWLVSDDNPLAARVAVNRAWEGFFGRGLVETLDDLGTQADPPTHPALLDLLALDFMKFSWSRKRLHREIALSHTYQQASRVSTRDLQLDPDNRQLARGPRMRLDAEILRDSALAASGQLTREFGGPPIRPPQPDSVTQLAYGSPSWDASDGGDRYRRSVYTFAKRTAPFAAFTTFDAPSGEVCTAGRMRSNNPLQALLLLNDPMYNELAVSLARRVLRDTDGRSERIERLLWLVLTRPPQSAEIEAVEQYLDHQQQRFESGQLDPAAICKDKQATSTEALWTLAARAVLNLDEAISKP